MDIVLKNNVFEFNGNFYLQIQGTAMGTKMVPAYANLFMGKLEIELKQLGNPHILIWKRFKDDIFTVAMDWIQNRIHNIHEHPK